MLSVELEEVSREGLALFLLLFVELELSGVLEGLLGHEEVVRLVVRVVGVPFAVFTGALRFLR